ncbi:MAG: DNA recombination protein RmuC [Fidelibacterota bacterium]
MIGIALGGGIVYLILHRQSQDVSVTKESIKDTFATLSAEVLQQSTDQFLKLAHETLKGQLEKGAGTLEEKKKLIDASLKELKTQLAGLITQTVELRGQMEASQRGINELSDTTVKLRQILSSSQARGQWGERMVEDILTYLGLKEGINFQTQQGSKEGKPDFTFLLPHGKRVNMDVKFPWDHYAALFSTDDEQTQVAERKAFLKDVKGHIRELTRRDYIDPAGGTLDFVLMFIPNEGIYAFLNKPKKGEDNLVEFAMDNRVLLCSPITLFAVLAMVRQSVQSFYMESQALEIQKLVQIFAQQWQKFSGKIEALGKSLNTVQKHYDDLARTRTSQLQKPLDKINEISLGTGEDKPLLEENDDGGEEELGS